MERGTVPTNPSMCVSVSGVICGRAEARLRTASAGPHCLRPRRPPVPPNSARARLPERPASPVTPRSAGLAEFSVSSSILGGQPRSASARSAVDRPVTPSVRPALVPPAEPRRSKPSFGRCASTLPRLRAKAPGHRQADAARTAVPRKLRTCSRSPDRRGATSARFVATPPKRASDRAFPDCGCLPSGGSILRLPGVRDVTPIDHTARCGWAPPGQRRSNAHSRAGSWIYAVEFGSAPMMHA